MKGMLTKFNWKVLLLVLSTLSLAFLSNFTQDFLMIKDDMIKDAISAQKMKFSIKDFFSKCDQIRRKLWIW